MLECITHGNIIMLSLDINFSPDSIDIQQLQADYDGKIEVLNTAVNTLKVCINNLQGSYSYG
jgi:hypothetical protein